MSRLTAPSNVHLPSLVHQLSLTYGSGASSRDSPGGKGCAVDVEGHRHPALIAETADQIDDALRAEPALRTFKNLIRHRALFQQNIAKVVDDGGVFGKLDRALAA